MEEKNTAAAGTTHVACMCMCGFVAAHLCDIIQNTHENIISRIDSWQKVFSPVTVNASKFHGTVYVYMYICICVDVYIRLYVYMCTCNSCIFVYLFLGNLGVTSYRC